MAEAASAVAEFHAGHPLRAGMPAATLATNLDVDQQLVERLVAESPDLTRIGPDVAAVDHERGLDEDLERRFNEAEATLRSGLAVPNAADLGLDPEQLHLLIRMERLVRVSDDLVFLPEQVEEITAILGTMNAEFTVADFRDRTGLSRKYAVPLLEWADKEGLTIRRGDVRRLR
jgi:selenocysteine-specific elongation factor